MPSSSCSVGRKGYKMYGGGCESKFVIDRSTVFPRELSLERCEGDEEAEHIEFTSDLRFTIDSLNKLGLGRSRMEITPLYHAHVLWSLTQFISCNKDGLFDIFVLNAGSHLTSSEAPALAAMLFGQNDPKELLPPHIVAASLTFLDQQEREKGSFELHHFTDSVGDMTKTFTRDGPANSFTRDELVAFADGGLVTIRLCVIVARSYFDLPKLLKKPTTVSSSKADMVARVLRGEKPAGCDWSITVARDGGDSGLPLEYHIHTEAFGRVSPAFKDMVAAKRGSHGGFVMPCFTPEDMPVVISLAYGVDPPIPSDIYRSAKLGRALSFLFPFDFMQDVLFRQWERTICEQALAVDKHDPASFSVLAKLLVFIWICPYGAFPVAKRVAVGVFADMVWQHAPPGEDLSDFIFSQKTVMWRALGQLERTVDHMNAILNAVLLHITMVATVRKVGLGGTAKENEKSTTTLPPPPPPTKHAVGAETKKIDEYPHPASSPTRGLSSSPAPPTVIPFEDEDEDVNDVEEQDQPAKWQCTIS